MDFWQERKLMSRQWDEGANNFLSKTFIVGTQKFSIVNLSLLKNITCQLIKLEFLVPTAISQHQEQTPTTNPSVYSVKFHSLLLHQMSV